jgi:hypothetical protein
MLPPEANSSDVFYRDIGSSERVLVRIEDAPQLFFARYFHKSQRWSIEGCSGDIRVLEWWPLPSGAGTLVTEEEV